MSTPLTVGKARLSTITVLNPDGSVNATAPITTSAGNPSALRVTVNPSNPREVAIVGLAPSAGVNANVTTNTGTGNKTAQTLIVVNAPTTDQSGPSWGPFSDEIDPPAWA